MWRDVERCGEGGSQLWVRYDDKVRVGESR